MPLYQHQVEEQFQLGLWKIEETIEAFHQDPIFTSSITNESKKLQWYASRKLVEQLTGAKPDEIVKSSAGKPTLVSSLSQLSISHTSNFAGVIASSSSVGIDLEFIHPRVILIAPKFLRKDEIDAIPESVKTESLILYWSAKEALYKLHGKGGLTFTTQLLIEPFELNQEGALHTQIKDEGWEEKKLEVRYRFFEDHVLTYVVGR